MVFPCPQKLDFLTLPISFGPPAATKALKAVFTAEILYVPLLKTSPTMLTLTVRAVVTVSSKFSFGNSSSF